MILSEIPKDVVEALELFEARDSGDIDLELICTRCEGKLCDIEHDDTLGVLVRQALGHLTGDFDQPVCSGDVGGKTYDHEPAQDSGPEEGDWCKTCGEKITWVGPGQYDYLHVNDKENQ